MYILHIELCEKTEKFSTEISFQEISLEKKGKPVVNDYLVGEKKTLILNKLGVSKLQNSNHLLLQSI